MTRPAPAPRIPQSGLLYDTVRAAALGCLRLAGWRVEGTFPEGRKFVLIAAPHTTNWDLPLMLAVAMHFRVKLSWMGKASLVSGPFGGLMRWLGCIPIDRSKSNNVVEQMIEAFEAADDLVVAIPPEGTRSKVTRWKSGFYNIAAGAEVPILLGFLDFPNKRGGLGGVVRPSGDFEKDLAEIQAFYAPLQGKFDDRTTDVDAGEDPPA